MKFGLITEGASEYRVIKRIISRYFKTLEPDVNQVQPKIINDKQETPGGWNEVLKYCGRDDLENVLVENDFLVIQIDTDQSQTAPFGISHHKDGNIAKTDEELHADVVGKLLGLINPDVLQKLENKILFAICIHSAECWLLPIYGEEVRKSTKTNCIRHLNRDLSRKNQDVIPVNDKNGAKANKSYDSILAKWKRREDIEEASKYNVGFFQFVESLKVIEPKEVNSDQE